MNWLPTFVLLALLAAQEAFAQARPSDAVPRYVPRQTAAHAQLDAMAPHAASGAAASDADALVAPRADYRYVVPYVRGNARSNDEKRARAHLRPRPRHAPPIADEASGVAANPYGYDGWETGRAYVNPQESSLDHPR